MEIFQEEKLNVHSHGYIGLNFFFFVMQLKLNS